MTSLPPPPSAPGQPPLWSGRQVIAAVEHGLKGAVAGFAGYFAGTAAVTSHPASLEASFIAAAVAAGIAFFTNLDSALPS